MKPGAKQMPPISNHSADRLNVQIRGHTDRLAGSQIADCVEDAIEVRGEISQLIPQCQLVGKGTPGEISPASQRLFCAMPGPVKGCRVVCGIKGFKLNRSACQHRAGWN